MGDKTLFSKKNPFRIERVTASKVIKQLVNLFKSIHEIETHAELYNDDIVLITEHLSENPTSKFDNLFTLNNYKCLEGNTGIGICIFFICVPLVL